MRPTRCDVDLGAIAHNVAVLQDVAGGADLCAVVKADAYGHGAVEVSRAALDAGADQLGVALVEEGLELRDAGITAPILLYSEPPAAAMASSAAAGLTISLYTNAGIEAAAAAADEAGLALDVHICVDTGMRRVGLEPSAVAEAVSRVEAHDRLHLTGVWTHCAVADEPGNPFTDLQFERFDEVVEANGLAARGLRLHVGNSAVAIGHSGRSADMVRCGIALYGIDPDPALSGLVELRPALRLTSEISFVKRISEGEGVGYGHRWYAPSDRCLATVPIGYADGVRRDLGLRGGEVLVAGCRRPIVGVVTMDQLMVDLGDDDSVSVGDEAVLIGTQGDETITANEVAALLDTIGYEVLCAVSKRVPRRYV